MKASFVLFKENDNFNNEGQDIDAFRLTHWCLIPFCLQQFATWVV